LGRRSDFERNERDYYPTPRAAILPLLEHLYPRTRFVEPCAGDYRLARVLEEFEHECVYACDTEPMDGEVLKRDAMEMDFTKYMADEIISNTPWDRDLLHPMIEHFASQRPTWLLIDSNWSHTKQAKPFMRYCLKEQMIGRVKWIENSKMAGKDDCSWFLFDKRMMDYPTIYFPAGWKAAPEAA
jgi:hypothetical protein